MPKDDYTKIRTAKSIESNNLLKKIYFSKGKLQGNFYFVTNGTCDDAGLIITLTNKDKKGAKANSEGKSIKNGLKGLRFAKGTIIYDEDTAKIVFNIVKGNVSESMIKKSFKNFLIAKCKMALLKKSVFATESSDASRPSKTAAREEEVDLTTGNDDIEFQEENEREIFQNELEIDSELKEIMNDPQAKAKIAKMNEELSQTFLDNQVYIDELMLDMAVETAESWWNNRDETGKPPEPYFPKPGSVRARILANLNEPFLPGPPSKIQFIKIKESYANIEKFDGAQLRKFTYMIHKYHNQLGFSPIITEDYLAEAESRLRQFQTVELLRTEKNKTFDQASEEYLRQLYMDGAKAQLRLSHIANGIAAEIDGCEAKTPPVHKIKGLGRARVKSNQNDSRDGFSDFSYLGDLARGSLVFTSLDKIVPGIEKFLNALPAESYIPKFKNRFATKKAGESQYRDIIMTFTLDNGHITEMQFHSKDIIAIKSDASEVPHGQSRQNLKDALNKIDSVASLRDVPSDTDGILRKIKNETEGSDWLYSGHDFYNITRWIEKAGNSDDEVARNEIINLVSSVADEMYKNAFDKAKESLEEAKLNELQNLSLETVRGWVANG
jgi:hypothetical protein